MEQFCTLAVLFAVIAALITDIKDRMIYKKLTIPVFFFGLIYSLHSLYPYMYDLSLSKQGPALGWDILLAWLGPVLGIFLYTLVLFSLGVFEGGDGQFLIAITPWLGARRMVKVILWFYPAAFVYLLLYLLLRCNFNIKALLREQINSTAALIKGTARRQKQGKRDLCSSNREIIEEKTAGEKAPAGMVPISIAVLLSLME